MPIFISYSHKDKAFVAKLAAHLVKNNANIWIDSWELNVGDSIINKIQDAIQESDALLVVLSKSSVESEWCKKELSAGLMRELEEKKVIVLPVLVEDCSIPLLLKEKLYADFRKRFNDGLFQILDAVAKISNMDQGRIPDNEGYADWAVDWGFLDEFFYMNFIIVYISNLYPITIFTEVDVLCNDAATDRYKQYIEAGLDWLGRLAITETIYEIGDKEEMKVILDNQFPQELERGIHDPKLGWEYQLLVKCRRLGVDNGRDQLVNISSYLKNIRDFMRSVARKPNKEEFERLVTILKSTVE